MLDPIAAYSRQPCVPPTPDFAFQSIVELWRARVSVHHVFTRVPHPRANPIVASPRALFGFANSATTTSAPSPPPWMSYSSASTMPRKVPCRVQPRSSRSSPPLDPGKQRPSRHASPTSFRNADSSHGTSSYAHSPSRLLAR